MKDPIPSKTTSRSKRAYTRHLLAKSKRTKGKYEAPSDIPKPQGDNVVLNVDDNHFTVLTTEEPGRSTVNTADVPGELDKTTEENPGVSVGTEPSEALKSSGAIQYQMPASLSSKVLYSKTTYILVALVAPERLIVAQSSLAIERIVKILCRPRLAKHSHRVEWICVCEYGRKRPIPIVKRYTNCY